MRFETYRGNPLEWSESPRVVPAPPGRRAGAGSQVLLVKEIAAMTLGTLPSFKILTSLRRPMDEPVKHGRGGGRQRG